MEKPQLLPTQSKSPCPLVITNGEEFRRVSVEHRYLLKVKSSLDRLVTMSLEPETSMRMAALDEEIEAYSARLQAYLNTRSMTRCDQTFDVSLLQKLPQTLINTRLTQCISLRVLSERVGLSAAQLSRYENSMYAPAPLDRVINIAEILLDWH